MVQLYNVCVRVYARVRAYLHARQSKPRASVSVYVGKKASHRLDLTSPSEVQQPPSTANTQKT